MTFKLGHHPGFRWECWGEPTRNPDSDGGDSLRSLSHASSTKKISIDADDTIAYGFPARRSQMEEACRAGSTRAQNVGKKGYLLDL